MKYQNNEYEDEIDRMRAKKSKNRPASLTQQRTSRIVSKIKDDFEIEDLETWNNQKSKKAALAIPVKKHKKNKKRKYFKWFFLIAALLAGFFFWKRPMNKGYWTIAVYGVDSRDGRVGKGALADVQILCSINQRTGEIRLASVFRDTYLKIDQEGNYNKINEAFFLGGNEQAKTALEENLDLHIDDYATFNWNAVADAINILGGIDLEITDKEFAYINAFITETVQFTGIGSVHLEHSGMVHLDGVQAVAYARLRLMDTDFNRTERQRKVLGLAMDKAKKADFNTLRILVGTVFPQISTSIGLDDLMGMAKNAKKYYIGQTSGFPFSHSEMKIGKKDCVIPTTLESNVIQLHAFLYDDTQYVPSDTLKSISSYIVEVSGIDTPGKDTESGKNVGAEGNIGNTGASQAPPKTESAAPQSENNDRTAAIDEKVEGSITESSETESSQESSEDFTGPAPSQEETVSQEEVPTQTDMSEPSQKSQVPETVPIGPGISTDGPGVAPSSSETASNNGPGSELPTQNSGGPGVLGP